MSELIGSDGPSSAGATLQALLGTMIPASTKHEVPGADDTAIFADFLATARPYLDTIDEATRTLDATARESRNAPFAELDPEVRLELAEQFRVSHPDIAGLLISLLCQCYYRDERVMASLGMPPRPPFPEGFEIPQGDWSLLDPVRARGTIYRKVP